MKFERYGNWMHFVRKAMKRDPRWLLLWWLCECFKKEKKKELVLRNVCYNNCKILEKNVIDDFHMHCMNERNLE